MSTLKHYLNLASLTGQKGRSFEEIGAAGYGGLQFGETAEPGELQLCRRLSLEYAASGRVNDPPDADRLAERWSAEGFVCGTLHVGWGLEDEWQAERLLEAVLQAADRYRVPLYVETHRATIFQDMWRTVGFVSKFPELLVNGDFSHWYTGQEMVYGGFERKFHFIEPVLARVRFLHGRIGNPGCMQVRIDREEGPQQKPEPAYISHFRQLWTACFRHGAGIFTPELLGPEIYYARTFPDGDRTEREESDRWQQSLLLTQIADDCYREAQARNAPPVSASV